MEKNDYKRLIGLDQIDPSDTVSAGIIVKNHKEVGTRVLEFKRIVTPDDLPAYSRWDMFSRLQMCDWDIFYFKPGSIEIHNALEAHFEHNAESFTQWILEIESVKYWKGI